MPAQTPEGASILRFIEHESGSHGPWMVRVVEKGNDPTTVLVEAFRDDEVETEPVNSLEVKIDEVQLYDDEINEATKVKIRSWLASLPRSL